MAGGCSFATSPVFGMDIFAGDLNSAADSVIARSRAGRGGYACLCNVHVLVTAQRDARVRQALEDSWLVAPDGAPVSWLQRRYGAGESRRIAGPDLMTRVLDLGRSYGLRHYLFGSSPATLHRLRGMLTDRLPGVSIVGVEAPPFDVVERLEPSRHLLEARPDIVWCSLGAPKQELWMNQFSERLSPSLSVGVGAAFDFLAGAKQRAPKWMQDAALEWLYRLGQEPRRLGGRYLRTNSEFVWLAMRQALKGS
jgi:N-acetylglucosaminyldiphosphoundecaprenol N-acetyl-beta-D-mannosaminyltransferase